MTGYSGFSTITTGRHRPLTVVNGFDAMTDSARRDLSTAQTVRFLGTRGPVQMRTRYGHVRHGVRLLAAEAETHSGVQAVCTMR